jgi:hypothetical protein
MGRLSHMQIVSMSVENLGIIRISIVVAIHRAGQSGIQAVFN